MSVHSAQLGHATLTSATPATIYTVPAGRRTIVKSALLYNAAAVANFCDLTFWAAAVQLGELYIPLAANGTSGGSFSEDLWVVLNAGEIVKGSTPHASVRVLLSGAELVL